MSWSTKIQDFNPSKYENAKSHLLAFASDEFIEKSVMFNVVMEKSVNMEQVLEIMRDLYVQLKRQTND